MTETLQDLLNYMLSDGWYVTVNTGERGISIELAPPSDRFDDVIVPGNGNPYDLIGRVMTIWHRWTTTGSMTLPK